MINIPDIKDRPPTGEEFRALQTELDNYRREKESIRAIIGQIGGNQDRRRDHYLNVGFIILLVALMSCDIVGHFWPSLQILPFQLSIEFGVLLVSIKIIWMIHKQAKVEHFQFWILNSIEFRINALAGQLNEMNKKLDEKK